MTRRPRRAMQPMSNYAPMSVPPPYAMPIIPPPEMGMLPGPPTPADTPFQYADPSLQQALAPWEQPTPQPSFLQPPDPMGEQYQPQGFLQNWAMNTGGQSPFAALGQYQPRNFGEGLVGGLVQGLGGALYNRGVQGVQQKRQDYSTQLAGTEAANQQRVASYTEAEKRRAETVNRLLEYAQKRRFDAANALPGATKPLDEYTVTPEDAAKNPALGPYIGKAVQGDFAERFGLIPPRPGTASNGGAGEIGGGSQSPMLTDEELDAPAILYLRTGQRPGGMGNRGAELNMRVLRRAAHIVKAVGVSSDIAANRAVLAADQKSYGDITRNLDAVTAFKNSALANARLALDMAKEIPDTGRPLTNAAVRYWAQQVGGSDKLSEFNTYISSIQGEFNRVINQPNLTGQLAYEARRDMNAVISGNFTLKQLASVVNALDRESENRKTYYQQQKNAIEQRLRWRNMFTMPLQSLSPSWFDQQQQPPPGGP